MALYVSITNATKAVVRYPKSEPDGLGENEVLVQIEKVAFTANVLGYASVGESMGYYSLFPSEFDGFGKVPSWGVGKIVASNCKAVPVGKRYCGTFPLSSNLVSMRVERATSSSFQDGAEHRRKREPLYSTYHECNSQTDPMYASREAEDRMLVFRPLFPTAWALRFTIMERLVSLVSSSSSSSKWPPRVILISASSKTSYSLAMLLKSQKEIATLEVVGLTSKKNASFVRSLPSAYDTVFAYDELDSALVSLASNARPAVAVDFAGDPRMLLKLSQALGGDLLDLHVVGATHIGEADLGAVLAGEGYESSSLRRPKFFFAPTVVAKIAKKEGTEAYMRALGADFRAFVSSPFGRDMRLQFISRPEELLRTYEGFAKGTIAGEENIIYKPDGVVEVTKVMGRL